MGKSKKIKDFKLIHMPSSHEDEDRKIPRKIKDIPIVQKLILRAIGYPLVMSEDEHSPPLLITTNPRLFQAYGIEQWSDFYVRKGDFLFDQFMFPDFAFEVVEVIPEGKITKRTEIILESIPKTPKQTSKKIPNVIFSDVVGHQKAKNKCKIIQKYLEDPESFGEWAPRNILFVGPPGTGKTMMAKALANSCKVPFSLVKATNLIGLFVGDGPKRVRRLFTSAGEESPCVVFIDELDAIGLDRRYQSIRGDVTEIVGSLLGELDDLEINSGIVTIGATNRSDLLDTALKSRFEEEVQFKLPDIDEREEIIRLYANKLPVKVEANFKKIALDTQNFSGRDLKNLLKNALHQTILEEKEIITEDFLRKNLNKLKNNYKNKPTGMFV